MYTDKSNTLVKHVFKNRCVLTLISFLYMSEYIDVHTVKKGQCIVLFATPSEHSNSAILLNTQDSVLYHLLFHLNTLMRPSC